MRKVVYWLLVFAVVFMILQDPTGTGELFASFFDWVGEGFSALLQFLDGLFDSTGEPSLETRGLAVVA